MSDKQLSLFSDLKQGTEDAVRKNAADIAKLSRRTDPETSRIAAERMVESGKLRTNQAKVLAALVEHPGSTYAELARYANLPDPEPARRLPELKEQGLVVNPHDKTTGKRATRVCEVRGTECSIWFATGKGYEFVEGE